MYEIKCIKCDGYVSLQEHKITEGYEAFCEGCYEDMDLSELCIVVGDSLVSLYTVVTESKCKGMSSVMLEDGSYIGCITSVLSSVNFDDRLSCYVYYYTAHL